MGKKFSYYEVESYIKSMGYILIDKIYKHNKQKITIVDDLGYYYYTTLFDLKSGNHPLAFFINNPYTIQNLHLWIKINNKPFKLLSEIYEGNNVYLEFKCLNDNCGEIFKATWQNIQSNWGCGYCAGKQVGLSNCLATKNPELALEWHPILNGNLTPYDVTCGNKQEVWWQCLNNIEHIWQANIHNRNCLDSECPYCNNKLPSKENNLLVVNPTLCEEWNYFKNEKRPEEYLPNSNLYVWWKCEKCKHEWYTSILNRNFSKSGCPVCNESKGEKRISSYFISKKINYIPQKEFDGLIGVGNGLLSYDFYLSDYNLLIEYQGEFHDGKVGKHAQSKKDLKRQKEHDRRKKEYAIKNNIKLLEIWYWDFDRIEEILENCLSKEAS